MRKVLIVSCILFLLLFGGIAQAATFRFDARGRNPNRDTGGILGQYWTLNFIVNIDPRINFYTEDGYSINSKLCEDQTFRISINGTNGEWVGEGGYEDSPPIEWVKNLENAKGPRYVYVIGGEFRVAVICESLSTKDLEIIGAYSLREDGEKMIFKVNSTDKVIVMGGNLKCAVYAQSIKQSPFSPMLVTFSPILETQSIPIDTTAHAQPKVGIKSILTDDNLSSQSSTYLKMTVTNTGNKDINIKDISLNVNSQLLACTSTKLMPGESTDCVLHMSPEDPALVKANVKYQYSMCGERQTKTESFSVGFIDVKPAECLNNSDCPENNICCAGKCHDSAKGMCVDVNADGVDEWIGK